MALTAVAAAAALIVYVGTMRLHIHRGDEIASRAVGHRIHGHAAIPERPAAGAVGGTLSEIGGMPEFPATRFQLLDEPEPQLSEELS